MCMGFMNRVGEHSDITKITKMQWNRHKKKQSLENNIYRNG
jgi:hypothetical protein